MPVLINYEFLYCLYNTTKTINIPDLFEYYDRSDEMTLKELLARLRSGRCEYDMSIGDYLPPFGRGEIADVRISTELLGRHRYKIDHELELEFPNSSRMDQNSYRDNFYLLLSAMSIQSHVERAFWGIAPNHSFLSHQPQWKHVALSPSMRRIRLEFIGEDNGVQSIPIPDDHRRFALCNDFVRKLCALQ